MPQTFFRNSYSINNIVQSDMENIEINFQSLVSNFSGPSFTADTTPGKFNYKTGTNPGLYVRSDDDTKWYSVLLGDIDQICYVYRNDSAIGWVIDESIQDVILSVKGGTNAYNVDGGTIAGTWTQNNPHAHTSGSLVSYHSHNRLLGPENCYVTLITDPALYEGIRNFLQLLSTSPEDFPVTGNTESDNAPNTWRPFGVVGTFQYPDLGDL